MQLFLEVNGDDVKKFCHGMKEGIDCFGEDKNRIFVMELFLHCADISNPYKPFHICSKWADLVSQEFFSQGDKERAAGIDVSPMMDRDTSNLFNMQMGFIEFVVSPLINCEYNMVYSVYACKQDMLTFFLSAAVVTLFPPLKELGELMLANYVQWGEKRKDEIRTVSDGSTPEKREEEVKKLEDRIGKFRDKMSFLATLLDVKRKHSSGSLISNRSNHK